MLNRETISFLKVLNRFTNTVCLNYPITVGNSADTDIIFRADLSKLDPSSFEGTLGVFKLDSLLNVFNLFDAYEIEADNKSITVKDDTTKVHYLLTNPINLGAYNAIKAEQFDRVRAIPSVLEFTLTANDINKLKTAYKSFTELNTVIIEGGDTPQISLVQTESTESMSSNSIKIAINDIASKNFKVGIAINTLANLPAVDYKVMVKYNEAKDKYRLLLDIVDNDILSVILPVKTNIN